MAIGVAASLVLTHLMGNLLYGVAANYPITLAANAPLLTAVSLVACYIPVRWATRGNPPLH